MELAKGIAWLASMVILVSGVWTPLAMGEYNLKKTSDDDSGGGWSAPDITTVPDETVVLFKEEIPDDVESIVDPYGEIKERNETLAFITVIPDDGKTDLFLAAMRSRDDVEAAYIPKTAVIDFVPDDPEFPEQTGFRQGWTRVSEGWNKSIDEGFGLGSHSAKIAVIDTGVGPHVDINPNTAMNDSGCGPTYNFAKKVPENPEDGGTHGTSVAGVAAAVTDNGTAVSGVGQVCIQDLKVLGGDPALDGASGAGRGQMVSLAILYAAMNGADVISLSLHTEKVELEGGVMADPPLMKRALQMAWTKGSLIVAAAGRSTCDETPCFPARDEHVIAVAGLGEDPNEKYGLSPSGPENEIAAPAQAVPVLSTGSDTTELADGTSLAAPFVSGIAAFMWSIDSNITRNEIRCTLDRTAIDIGPSGRDDDFGYGRLDAEAPVDAAINPNSEPKLRDDCGYDSI